IAGILAPVDENLAIDLGANDLVGALRNRCARPPFALGMGSRSKTEDQRRQCHGECGLAETTVHHEFLPMSGRVLVSLPKKSYPRGSMMQAEQDWSGDDGHRSLDVSP